MYIDNGPDQGFGTEYLVTSEDNQLWTPVRKDRIKLVNHVFVGNVADKYRYTNSCQVELVGTKVKFDIQDIQGKSTWVGTKVGLDIAIREIEDWLST